MDSLKGFDYIPMGNEKKKNRNNSQTGSEPCAGISNEDSDKEMGARR